MMDGIGESSPDLVNISAMLYPLGGCFFKIVKTNILQMNLLSTYKPHDISFWITGPWWNKSFPTSGLESPVVII